jgi:hypothetical protein
MIPRTRLSVLSAVAGDAYAKRVLATANLFAYWPMSEGSGATVNDEGPNGFDGTYSGPLLGQAGIGDGRTCPWFDGSNDECNVFSAGLASAWNWSAFTIGFWVKMNSAAAWTDGVNRRWVAMGGGTNFLWLRKAFQNNLINIWLRLNGSDKAVNKAASYSDWFHFGITVQAGGTSYYYLNGSATSLWAPTPAPSADALASWTLSASAETQHGWLAHVAVWNTALSAAQMAALAAPC